MKVAGAELFDGNEFGQMAGDGQDLAGFPLFQELGDIGLHPPAGGAQGQAQGGGRLPLAVARIHLNEPGLRGHVQESFIE